MSFRVAAVVTVLGLCAVNLLTGLALSGQVAKVKAAQACTRLVKDGSAAILALAGSCPPPIAAAQISALRSADCDAALSARPENLYAVKSSCSLPVKILQAQRDAALGEAGRLTATLNSERLDRDGAIARASTAATTQAERKARADAALKAAPRDGAGLVVCDARCVRDRWTAAAPQRP